MPTGKALRQLLRALSVLFIVLVLIGSMPSTFAQSCVPGPPLTDNLQSASNAEGDFCLAVRPGQTSQLVVEWTLTHSDASHLWSLRLELVEGQSAALSLQAVTQNGAAINLARADNSAGGGAIELGDLLLDPGTYLVTVQPLQELGAYNLTAGHSGETLAIDTVAGPQVEAFSFATVVQGSEVRFPWTIMEAAADKNWTVTLMATRALARLNVTSADGGLVSSAFTQHGVARLADLGLGPGAYDISVSGLPEGSRMLVRAEMAASRGEGVESEPNDSPLAPSALNPAVGVEGRLLGTRTDQDRDNFALIVPETWRDQIFDLALVTPAETRLALMDSAGNLLQERRGTGTVTLHDLVLEPGRYILGVTGGLSMDEVYRLSVSRQGPHASGREREPNDDVAKATSLPDGLKVNGTLEGDEADTFSFIVEGPPQLWRLTARGDGIRALTKIDASGLSAAQAPLSRIDDEASLSGMLLLPGRHFIQVQGTGDYSIGVSRQASFDLSADEIEPNDQAPLAQPLRLGTPRTGRLDRDNDVDWYRFSLPGDTHVALTLAGVAGVDTYAALQHQEDGTEIARLLAPASGNRSLAWNGELTMGDYLVLVTSAIPSDAPYQIGADTLAWGPISTDREPNNTPDLARPVPPDLTLIGTLLRGDSDWYKLPPLDQSGRLMLRSDSASLANAYMTVSASTGQSGDWVPLAMASSTYLAPLEPGVWAADLPAHNGLFLAIANGDGPYSAVLEVPNQTATSRPNLVASLQLEAQSIASYHDVGQRVGGQLRLYNAGNEKLELRLEPHVGDERWTVSLEANQAWLAPGERKDVPVRIDVAPDVAPFSPIAVAVMAYTAAGWVTVAEATLTADEATAPVSPLPLPALPPELLGGLNVAWSALGASVSWGHEALIDGQVGAGSVATISMSDGAPDPVIDLVGDEPIALAGVVLDATTFGSPRKRLNDFKVAVSDDGISFAEVFEGSLSQRIGEQGFVFADAPTSARFVRLEALSNHGAVNHGGFDLGEFKVIAAGALPKSREADAAGASLSRPDLGGHVVWMSPPNQQPQALLTPEPDHPLAETPAGLEEPVEWVIAFLNNRAAKIDRIAWQEQPDVAPERAVASVRLSISTASAKGPWTDLGDWPLARDKDGHIPPFVLPEPVWARYVRFSVLPPFRSWSIALPETLSVHEVPIDDTYRSSLGEWGAGRPEVAYEQLLARPAEEPPIALSDGVPDDREHAQVLSTDTAIVESVQLGIDEDWFRVEVPEDRSLTLNLAFKQDDVAVELAAENGTRVNMIASPGPNGEQTLEADLDPGAYYVRIHEPVRSVVVAWDTSGSVGGAKTEIVQSVVGLAATLKAGREVINLIPFRGHPSSPLLEHWTDDPVTASAALHNYPWMDASSNAEAALLAAAKLFEDRAGAHAVVIITDAESDGTNLSAVLWEALDKTRPRVIVLGVPTATGGIPALQSRALMQDWATLNGGWVQTLISPNAIEHAFDQLARQLRRPKTYRITATLGGHSSPKTAETPEVSAAELSADPSADLAGSAPPAPSESVRPLPPAPPSNGGAAEVSMVPSGSIVPELTVAPSLSPGAGQLSVVLGEPTDTASAPPIGDRAIEIILDASGSMLQRLDGVRRIDTAKRALDELFSETLPLGTQLALRVFGQGPRGSCDTELTIPLSELNPETARSAIAPISPTNGAKTPIAASLRAVTNDLASAAGRHLVILLTDGEETCEGDVSAEITALRSAGVDVRVNIVGFSVNDGALEAKFAEWAAQGGGLYFSATDLLSLRSAMQSAVLPEFEVIDQESSIVARGLVGSGPITIEAGTYRVRVLGLPPQELEVVIQPGEITVQSIL